MIPKMRRSFTIIAGVAALAGAGGCHRNEAAVCRTSPPERSEDYQRWADAVSAARCKFMRLGPLRQSAKDRFGRQLIATPAE